MAVESYKCAGRARGGVLVEHRVRGAATLGARGRICYPLSYLPTHTPPFVVCSFFLAKEVAKPPVRGGILS